MLYEAETLLRSRIKELKVPLKRASAVLGMRPGLLSSKLNGWSSLSVTEQKKLSDFLDQIETDLKKNR